jgi:hypothetical protein
LSEKTTPTDLFFCAKRRKQKLVIDGAPCPTSAIRQGRTASPRHLPRWDYEVDYQCRT